jgi:hypothetical protein
MLATMIIISDSFYLPVSYLNIFKYCMYSSITVRETKFRIHVKEQVQL